MKSRSCPCCGSSDVIGPRTTSDGACLGGDYGAECRACGLRCDDVDAWNRRAPGPATKMVLEKLMEMPAHWKCLRLRDAEKTRVLGSMTVADVVAFIAEWKGNTNA